MHKKLTFEHALALLGSLLVAGCDKPKAATEPEPVVTAAARGQASATPQAGRRAPVEAKEVPAAADSASAGATPGKQGGCSPGGCAPGKCS